MFACTDRPDIPDGDRPTVKTALANVVAASDFQTLGVCADSAAEGYAALATYLAAFDLEAADLPKTSAIAGPIYIKFNSKTGQHYASDYPGDARGVLVCCHCEYPELNSDMYGHLPLDLFD